MLFIKKKAKEAEMEKMKAGMPHEKDSGNNLRQQNGP